jgi:hypothetical protein
MQIRTPLAMALAMLSCLAHADIYRCTIDGRLTFRDKPCPDQKAQDGSTAATPAMAGCYEVSSAGWESGRQVFVIRIAPAGAGKFSMVQQPDPSGTTLPMRHATAQELLAAKQLLKFPAEEAIVMEVPPGTPNMPAIPIGLYRGLDQYRDATYFFFGFLANGAAKPVACH